jgi:NADH:ubiquinone oxidoreductase subunit E
MSVRTIEMALATPGLDQEGRPTRVPLGAGKGAGHYDEDFGAERMLINIGPQHPATHGVLRLVIELEGEVVKRCIPHLGYLHSGFEKLGEYRHYNQIIPLTDRTDYLSPMANNVGLALAAEKLMGIEVPERCRVLRVIACEMSRIISHLVWLGTTGIDLGAYTPFLWSFQERERVYNLQEQWTGARLTTSLTRIGGMMADIPDGWEAGLREFTRTFPTTLKEVDTMFTRNAIWIGRTQGVGVLTAEEATNYSLSGPMLPALWIVQEARGWISEASIGEVAEAVDVTPAYVKGVVTFYTMYHTHPVGRHFIQVCTTTPCNICGAEDVVQALLKSTGCGELGATSPDGRFTVIEVECLGACGFATPILVDDDFIENVTPDKVPGILQRYP